jgi:hypothetical protein
MSKNTYIGAYNPNQVKNPYTLQTDHGVEDIRWIL